MVYVNPFLGLALYMVFDGCDTFILEDFGGLNYFEYENLDKVIDSVTFLILLPIGFKYGVFYALLALLIFRLLGTFIYLLRRNEKYLILFPDFYISFLFFTIILKETGLYPKNNLSEYIFLLAGLIIFQLSMEIVYHYVYPKLWKGEGMSRKLLRIFGYKRKRVM